MSTLEEELMADFADSGDEESAELNPEIVGGDDEDQEMVDEEAEYEKKKQQSAPSGVQGAQALWKTLQPVLERIREVQDQMMEVLDGESIEDSPEYKLLQEANELSTSIDAEVDAVHKSIVDSYTQRFPYLSDLVKNKVAYAKTVAALGNHPLKDIKAIPEMKTILSQAQLMVVTVEATRAQGRDLEEKELEAVSDACKLLLHLDQAKDVLLDFVTSRMSVFAPNLTELIGAKAAAQFISATGGLASLAKTPACNLTPLGSNRADGLGLATNTGVRHQGFLYHSPILQTIRPDLKKQGMRIVSAKLVLAARVDASRSAPDGSTGVQLKEECEKRLDKLTEVNKNMGTRALPAPDDKPARKRGGRRARAQKASVASTELAKAQNRMAFGKEEKEIGYGDAVKGMGMIGASDTGRLRAQQIDPKTRAKLSKKQGAGWGGDTTLGAASSLKGFGGSGTTTSLRAHGLRTGGVGLGGAGTSSIAFTPVQGLELVDPRAREEANRKRKADEDRWFKGGSFTQLGGASKVDAGGFKVPALPNKKPKTET